MSGSAVERLERKVKRLEKQNKILREALRVHLAEVHRLRKLLQVNTVVSQAYAAENGLVYVPPEQLVAARNWFWQNYTGTFDVEKPQYVPKRPTDQAALPE